MPGKDDLTPTESAILVVLLSENRDIRNPDLKEHFGFELKKPSRDKLNRLNLWTQGLTAASWCIGSAMRRGTVSGSH